MWFALKILNRVRFEYLPLEQDACRSCQPSSEATKDLSVSCCKISHGNHHSHEANLYITCKQTMCTPVSYTCNCPVLKPNLWWVPQVCSRLRKLVCGFAATRCNIGQPHLSPKHLPSIWTLPLPQLTAVTYLDCSRMLDWIQHPSTSALLDINALTMMTQLRSLNLRPPKAWGSSTGLPVSVRESGTAG
jgi:hypothetical protein